MSITYVHLLLAFTGALLFVLIQVLLRRPWQSKPGLETLLDRHNPIERELYHEYLVPLLVYEEDYPSFGRILRLVLERFPLGRFLQEEAFEKALTDLRDAVFEPSNREDLVWAMCQIVHTFVRDPDVEYRCRPRLQVLVDQFLKEVES
ncbi:hypothetical protein MYX84_12600 [Acidobacteria bacterium AH-259-O06]|nr:hypothetical protein [Acidobacteria bacterium AH-259-O06]